MYIVYINGINCKTYGNQGEKRKKKKSWEFHWIYHLTTIIDLIETTKAAELPLQSSEKWQKEGQIFLYTHTHKKKKL